MTGKKKDKIGGWGNYPMTESYVSLFRGPGTTSDQTSDSTIPRGLGRSYGDQAINTDRNVALCTDFNFILSFDEDTGELECQAGLSLLDIITVFAPRGWFPLLCPGTKYITVGGAIANDVHGKAHHIDGSFVNCVDSFTILLADGSVVTASRTDNSDLFWANFGGLGLLGIILTAKIGLRRIETTYFKQQAIAIDNLDELLNAVEKYESSHNYSVAWIDPLSKGKKLGKGVLTIGNVAKTEELPPKLKENPLVLHSNKKLNLPIYLPNFALNNLTVRVLNRVISYVQNSAKDIAHYDKFFFPLDAINDWNKGYGKRGFIQYQFVIPKEEAMKNLNVILQSISESGCTPFLNVFKAMGPGQKYLSFPFEGYTLAIDFPVSAKLMNYIPVLNQLVINAKGRVYLGKDAVLTQEDFRTMYPDYSEWLIIKRKYDPSNTFSSDLSRRLGLNS